MTGKELTAVQRYVLVTMMINAEPMPYKIFSNSLTAPKRGELVAGGLLEVEKTKAGIILELTQKGQDRAFEELHREFPEKGGTFDRTLFTALTFLGELIKRTGTSPRDLFRFRVAVQQPVDEPVDQPHDLDERIRKAYSALVAQPGEYVMLDQLRTALPDVGRSDFDAALVLLNRSADVNIVPESNQKVLTEEQRDAAVIIGNQRKHLIAIKA